jgi:hypothetical protein
MRNPTEQNMTPNVISQHWLKIIRDHQQDRLKNEKVSGFDWGNCLRAKVPERTKRFDIYGHIRKGDKFVFYVLGDRAFSYKATLDSVKWIPKKEQFTFKKAREDDWIHNLYFTDIEEIKCPIDLNVFSSQIPFLARYGKNWGLAIKDCSMWKLRKIDYDAIVGCEHP